MANTTVQHFKDVRFEVDGTNYFVATILMVLRENAIPTIRLTIDPAHSGDVPAVGTFRGADATEASLSRIVQWHKQFQDWSAEKKSAKFSMTVWAKYNPDEKGDGIEEQTIELNDWVITGSGIKGVSASGGFSLEIELSHPIVKLDYAPTILSGARARLEWTAAEMSKWSDIPTALSEIMTRYARLPAVAMHDPVQNCGPRDMPSNEKVRKGLRTLIEEAAKAVKLHLVWDTTDYGVKYSAWPMQLGDNACMSGLRPLVKYAFKDYVIDGVDVSPYEVLVQYVAGDFSTVIVPTYWKEALEMRPYSPWLDPQVYLRSIDISDITFPGTDPAAVAGITMLHSDPVTDTGWGIFLDSVNESGSEQAFIGDELSYVPQKILDNLGKWGGRILRMAPPRWILGTASYGSSAKGSESSNTPAEDSGDLTTSGNIKIEEGIVTVSADPEGYGASLQKIRGAILRAAKQAFMTKFRQNVQCVIRCRLLLTYESSYIDSDAAVGNGFITPGYVFRVIDDFVDAEGLTSSEPIFDFYCTDVVHSIDCQTGQVSTELQGRYVRPMIDIDRSGYEGIIESGELNPIYGE